MDQDVKNVLTKVGMGIAAIFLIVAVTSCWTTITPGNAGVMFNKITGSLRTVDQGMNGKIPFVTTVQSYPIALRTYTMVKRAEEGSSVEDDSLDLPTKEGQHIKQDISVTYNTSPTQAAAVFKNFRGADIQVIENTFIRRTIITVTQNASGQMSLQELISTARAEFQDSIEKHLAKEMETMGFHLDRVNLGASHLPKVIEEQMQAKMAAQQEAQKAEYTLQKARVDAQSEVATAEGNAKAMVIAAKAKAEANQLIQRTLSADLIRVKAIEKWNGVLPQVSGSATPFINMKSFERKEAE
jgi:regulator of protease activity HflC (stomatin/prohibitin superfamily)